ncbi:MAG TPA: glycine oxidase ThiO [Gammaproteobacteria bacterium]|nr:glycine oxidase ThiO [Gammaproteobacteria bacterium]
MHSNGSTAPATSAADTLVIGGGIMGLTTAIALAERGYSVSVVDPGRRQGIGSWSGGGILSPLYPWRYDPSVNELARRSQQGYPELCRQLRERAGVDPELRNMGMVYADLPSRAPVDHDRSREWAREEGVEFQELDGDELLEAEPELTPLAEGALRLPTTAWVRNPRVMRGLVRLAQLSGVALHDGVTILGLRTEGDRVRGVYTDSGEWDAEQVVVAAGPWSGPLLERIGVNLPVRPVKGTMLLLQANRQVLDQVVMAGDHYLIPRADNRILVGSTMEDAGFDTRTSLGSVRALSQAAVEIVPATANMELETYWSGLRPGSPDDRPFIGPVTGIDGLYVNSGHFRNGVVHAPASAELIAALMAGEETPVDPAPFAPDRGVERAAF